MDRNEIFEYVKQQYSTDPEYLWADSPNYAVLRHSGNKKWYAIIMDVSAERLGLERDGIIDIMDVKCPPDMVDVLRQTFGFLPAYHMNKRHWITILLDGSIPDNQILDYLDWSFDLTDSKSPKQSKTQPDELSSKDGGSES